MDVRLRDADRRAAAGARPGRAAALAADRRPDARSRRARTGTTTSPARPSTRSRDPVLKGIEEQVTFEYEQAFMFYLPRICEHCLNPSCVASCPSGAMYKREEDGDRARRPGQVPRLALLRLGLPLQEGLLQPPQRQGREVHALLPAASRQGQPTICSETCVGRHPLPRPRPLRRRPRRGGRVGARRTRPARRADGASSSTRDDPEVQAAGARRRHRRRLARGRARARRSTRSPSLPARAAAAPRVPDAADGLVRAAALAGRERTRDRRLRGRPRRHLPGDRHGCGSRSSTSPTCSPPATPT